MTYTPGIPLPTDYIDESQPIIKANFDALDSVFDVDHYKFSDATADLGKHKTVTTPAESSHPSTSADEPVFYAYEDLAAIGVLQYSRAGSDAVPSPVTHLQGTIASLAGATNETILDFSGLTYASGHVSARSDKAAEEGIYYIFSFRNGATAELVVNGVVTSGTFLAIASGTALQLRNGDPGAAISDVRWTINFDRIEVS